ncbi:hypothetical protein [Janthinobacterium psychrotolerans]|uniref:Uncharacterized protein n=1 Tax=Janthinobacterium psychrotolerans TaxID=1747903 RepID=A0A1A7C0D3_9BURK|nr:hypothetical protein [Janthinobacterium psychrotolerans]OBV38464.1 hypothetical protein ASR47_100664 [Janthinobacterium psychrotolerans]
MHLAPASRCEVAGRGLDLRYLGCRELGYGHHSALPLHPFVLRLPADMLDSLVGAECDAFVRTCRDDDALLGECDLPALREAGYPDLAAMLQRHRPLLAELLVDYLYRELLEEIARRCGAEPYRPRRSGDPRNADGRAYFTVNALQTVRYVDDEVLLEGQGYFGVYIIWLEQINA